MAGSFDLSTELALVGDVIGRFDSDFDTSSDKWGHWKQSLATQSTRPRRLVGGDGYIALVSTAVMTVLVADASLTFQHIEAWLRRRGDTPVWLSATKNPSPDTLGLMMLNGSGVADFALHVVVCEPIHAMVEIAEKCGGSYAANFDRLANTGAMVAKQ